MKKFLSKLPVMISFLVVAVVVLGVYIGLLARPVASGMSYKYKLSDEDINTAFGPIEEVFGSGVKDFSITSYIKFKDGKTLTTSAKFDYKLDKKMSEEEKKTFEEEFKGLEEESAYTMFYLRNGNKIKVYETEEEYKAAKEDSKLDWKTYDYEVSAFSVKAESPVSSSEKVSYSCAGTIVLTVVLGIVELALVAFSALSVVYFVGSKKKAA